jgi:hypothetical protein
MRRWDVRLYRYGLRLTYDLVVPEPAATMRKAYVELEALRARQKPFTFPVKHTGIDRNTYVGLADQYQASVPPYPRDPEPLKPSKSQDSGGGWQYVDVEFVVPDRAEVTEIYLDAQVGDLPGPNINFGVKGAVSQPGWNGEPNALFVYGAKLLLGDGTPFLARATGPQKVVVFTHHADETFVQLMVHLRTTDTAIEQWRNEVWNALYNAAQTAYYAEQQDLAGRIAALEARLAGVDTLTLRREENDEIMKSVLQYFVGSGFDFMPKAVTDLFELAMIDTSHGTAFEGATAGAQAIQWAPVRQFEEMVRFVNQAVEWENVVTFLYSYFWDIPDSWDFIRGLRHPDATRQAFLRAGSARVVLTVRKGWEARWIRFTQDGVIDAEESDGGGNPYMTIAREIAAYDDRNYPGVPPANPGRSAVRLQDTVYTTAAETVAAGAGPVIITVADSAGFVAGLPVVLDADDEHRRQESTRVVSIPDGTHLEVDGLAHAHEAPFAVLQPGEKGALIAEWHEYTPSAGTDIALTSNLTTIA